jgi:hypothetical protein
MRRRAGQGLFAVILVVGLVAVAGQAAARDRIPSTVTIRTGETATGQEYLTGRVNSPKAKCRRNRNVVLYWDVPGPPASFVAVADDATDRQGRWRIQPPDTTIPLGRYYVKVTPITRRGDRCTGARSRTITVS